MLLELYMKPFYPTEQISGKLVLDNKISIQTHWLWVLHQTDSRPYLIKGTYFWPKSTRTWTFTTHSLIHSDVTWAIYEAILTYWTNFWQISPRWWTFYIKSLTPSDDTSATEYCIFDLMNILLSNWYSFTHSDFASSMYKLIFDLLNKFLAN